MPLIRYEVSDAIATITIDRAEKRNAMTFDMATDFFAAVRQAGADDDVRALIITGVPGSFCAGTDLAAVSETLEAHGGRSLDEQLEAEKDVQWALAKCPKPTIAAIDGAAVGMGAEFTCQCDYRIATPRARLAWNFVQRGLVPDRGAASWLLPRQIGLSAALRLLYSGEFISGDEAFKLGYVSELVAPEQLAEAARTRALSFATGSPLAIQLTKRLVFEGLSRTADEHLAASNDAMRICMNSEDHAEGVAAFVEKRAPRFTGK